MSVVFRGQTYILPHEVAERAGLTAPRVSTMRERLKLVEGVDVVKLTVGDASVIRTRYPELGKRLHQGMFIFTEEAANRIVEAKKPVDKPVDNVPVVAEEFDVERLPNVKYNGRPVMLTKWLAQSYEVGEQQIQQNFNNHKDQFVEGVHYFKLEGAELQAFKNDFDYIEVIKGTKNVLILWTQEGTVLHCKPLGSAKAWEMQHILVERFFSKDSQPARELTPDEQMAKAVLLAQKILADKNRELDFLKAENAQQKQIIGELQPKSDYMDVILKSNEQLTITQIAKDYGMAGGEMNQLLNKYHIQYKQNGEWLLYSKYQALGYTHSAIHQYTKYDGTVGTKTYMRWTQKGRLFLYGELKKHGILPTIEQDLLLPLMDGDNNGDMDFF